MTQKITLNKINSINNITYATTDNNSHSVYPNVPRDLQDGCPVTFWRESMLPCQNNYPSIPLFKF